VLAPDPDRHQNGKSHLDPDRHQHEADAQHLVAPVRTCVRILCLCRLLFEDLGNVEEKNEKSPDNQGQNYQLHFLFVSETESHSIILSQ
jgi:hypothetical protein